MLDDESEDETALNQDINKADEARLELTNRADAQTLREAETEGVGEIERAKLSR